MQMLMQQIEEETCACGSGLDEGQTVCADCQDEQIRKERRQEESQDYAARRSQYRHLIHEAVREANESIVINPVSGDWGMKGIGHD